MYALYVTHPEVVIDPNVPTPRWGLSPLGRSRAERFANHPLVNGVTRIVSSTETKALELAAILAEDCGAPVDSGDKFGESDRSSTGFVPLARILPSRRPLTQAEQFHRIFQRQLQPVEPGHVVIDLTQPSRAG